MGKLTAAQFCADFIAINSVEVTSGVAHSYNPRQEPREAARKINKQCHNHPCHSPRRGRVPRCCIQISGTSFDEPHVRD